MFLSTNDDLPPTTCAKLKEIMNDPTKARMLKIEIAITVDAMEPFVRAMYKLERDGPLSLFPYDICRAPAGALQISVGSMH